MSKKKKVKPGPKVNPRGLMVRKSFTIPMSDWDQLVYESNLLGVTVSKLIRDKLRRCA
jgi:hypothetical protein